MEVEEIKNFPAVIMPDDIETISVDIPVEAIEQAVTTMLEHELSIVYSDDQEKDSAKAVATLRKHAKSIDSTALAVYRAKTADIDAWKKGVNSQAKRLVAAADEIGARFDEAKRKRESAWKEKLVIELNAMFDKNNIDRHNAYDIINPLIKKGSFTDKGEIAKSARTVLISYVDGLVAVRQRKIDRLAMMATVSTQSGLASPITEKELKYGIEEYSDAEFMMAVHDAIQHRKDIEAAAAEAAAAKIEAEKAVEVVEEIKIVTEITPIAAELPDVIDIVDESDIFERQDENNEPEAILALDDGFVGFIEADKPLFVDYESLLDLDVGDFAGIADIIIAEHPTTYNDLCIKQTEPAPLSDDDFFSSIAESLGKDDVASELLAAGANGIKDLPIETYHSIGGLSGSKIRIGVLSPRHIDNINLFYDDTERDAFLIGSAYHDKVLLPELFGKYIEMPDFKSKAECGRTIAESKAEFVDENESKVVLPKGALEKVNRMANNTMASFGELIRGQLKECSYGVMIAGVFVKARPDIIITEQIGIFEPGDDIDLKSLSIDVYDDFALKNHFKKCGYYHHAALRNVARRELGLKVGYNYLLLQRSQGGCENRVIRLLPSEVVAVERDVMESLSEYKLYKDDASTLYSRVATI